MKMIVVTLATGLLVACGTVAGVGAEIKGASDWTREQMTGQKVKL